MGRSNSSGGNFKEGSGLDLREQSPARVPWLLAEQLSQRLSNSLGGLSLVAQRVRRIPASRIRGVGKPRFKTRYANSIVLQFQTNTAGPTRTPDLVSREDPTRAQGVELGVTRKIKNRRSSTHAARRQLFDRPPPTDSMFPSNAQRPEFAPAFFFSNI